MSVLIHYRGKLAPDADIDSLFDFVRKYARRNGWKTLEWEETGKTFAVKDSGKDHFRPTLEVWDEGEYFETKDRNRLEKIRRQRIGKPPDEPILDELRRVMDQAEKLKNPFDSTSPQTKN